MKKKNKQKEGIIIIVIFVLAGISVSTIVLSLNILSDRFNALCSLRNGYDDPDSTIFLTFEQFYSFYSINPNGWKLEQDEITYIKPSQTKIRMKAKNTDVDEHIFGKEFNIQFRTRKDCRKYFKFFNNKENQLNKNAEIKTTKEFIELMQEDLDKFNN